MCTVMLNTTAEMKAVRVRLFAVQFSGKELQKNLLETEARIMVKHFGNIFGIKG